jgi:hypothetical protein
LRFNESVVIFDLSKLICKFIDFSDHFELFFDFAHAFQTTNNNVLCLVKAILKLIRIVTQISQPFKSLRKLHSNLQRDILSELFVTSFHLLIEFSLFVDYVFEVARILFPILNVIKSRKINDMNCGASNINGCLIYVCGIVCNERVLFFQ